jgi:hypothetical protein
MKKENIIIAKFMGLSKGHPNKKETRWKDDWFEQLVIDGNDFECGRRHTYLQFIYEWNWLMPVVHKCLGICHKNMLNEWENSFADAFLCGDINVMVKEVISFIEFYNKNKKSLVVSK